jgi:PKD domain/A-macroglobulin TED domain/Prenyltransferase and squalene oxidase repeat
LPASKSILVLAILVVLLVSTMFSLSPTMTTGRLSNVTLPPTLSSSVGRALQWLVANQSSSGSFGAYEEHITAAAAYALWLNDSASPEAALSYSWLATQLDSSSAWFWGTEADVPGAVLYSIASSDNIHLINTTSVASNLLQLQQPHSGFEGYFDSTLGQTVTSSVDTDMALLGLISSGLIPPQNETNAVQYLLSLQNLDGSFNLTSTIPYDPLYSLGPDLVSITALTLLALKSAGLTLDEAPISNGLSFLSEWTLANLCSDGHTYSAALSTLAFKAYDQLDDAIRSSSYILSQQNSDGGFSDVSRSYYPESNALDTGWAAVALETQPLESGNIPQIKNCPPVANFSFAPETPVEGIAVHFNASGSVDRYADQLSYNWTFGDGSTGQGSTPSHTYLESGNFTVTLTVIDTRENPGPLSDTRSLTLMVLPATVQKASTLTLNASEPWIVAGIIGLVAIVGFSFYLGRRSAKRPVT